MSKTYTNCPTCGGLAEFISENFKRAGLLIDSENNATKSEIKKLIEENVRLTIMLESQIDINNRTNPLSSSDLLNMYFSKLRQEQVENAIREGEWYAMSERMNFFPNRFPRLFELEDIE